MYGKIESKNSANIEAIQIWMLATAHHPDIKNHFEQFEAEHIDKKFRIKLGTFMDMVYVKNYMSTSAKVTNGDKTVIVERGEKKKVGESFPVRITLDSEAQSFDFSDEEHWDMKIVNTDLKKGGYSQEIYWRDEVYHDRGNFCIILKYENAAPVLELDVHNIIDDDDFEFKFNGIKH
jgi:hypothetical protein